MGARCKPLINSSTLGGFEDKPKTKSWTYFYQWMHPRCRLFLKQVEYLYGVARHQCVHELSQNSKWHQHAQLAIERGVLMLSELNVVRSFHHVFYLCCSPQYRLVSFRAA